MTTETYPMDADIYDLNLLFLQKAREWLVSGQEHKARLLLGVTPEAAAALRRLPLSALRDLAASNVLCYTLRLPPQLWRELARQESAQRCADHLRWHVLAAATRRTDDPVAP